MSLYNRHQKPKIHDLRLFSMISSSIISAVVLESFQIYLGMYQATRQVSTAPVHHKKLDTEGSMCSMIVTFTGCSGNSANNGSSWSISLSLILFKRHSTWKNIAITCYEKMVWMIDYNGCRKMEHSCDMWGLSNTYPPPISFIKIIL